MLVIVVIGRGAEEGTLFIVVVVGDAHGFILHLGYAAMCPITSSFDSPASNHCTVLLAEG